MAAVFFVMVSAAAAESYDEYVSSHMDGKSAFARIVAVIDSQEQGLYSPKDGGDPAYSINKRRLNMTRNGFLKMLINTLRQCEDFGDYVGSKKSTSIAACEEGIVVGVKDWAEVSKDRRVSMDSWYVGASKSMFIPQGGPGMIASFGHWAGMARVNQARIDRVKQ